MKARNNPFLILRKKLEYDISNIVKDWTGNDLFDLTNLFVLFGGGSVLLLYFFIRKLISQETFLQAWILWFTAFVLLRYTKETYWLKKIAQKQIEVEQEPYVVCKGLIKLVGTERHKVALKNVGRGSALRVTCTTDKSNRDKPFFEDSEPHAYYLSMNEEVTSLIDGGVINQIKSIHEGGYYYFYIYTKSQLGNMSITRVKLKLRPEEFVVMENQRMNNKAERKGSWME